MRMNIKILKERAANAKLAEKNRTDDLKDRLMLDLDEAVGLLIHWQSVANGTTEQRAEVAAKVSAWLAGGRQ